MITLIKGSKHEATNNVSSLKRAIAARQLVARQYIDKAKLARTTAEENEAMASADECLGQCETLVATLKALQA